MSHLWHIAPCTTTIDLFIYCTIDTEHTNECITLHATHIQINHLVISSKPCTEFGSTVRSFFDDLHENEMNFFAFSEEKKFRIEEKRNIIQIIYRIFCYFPNYSSRIYCFKMSDACSVTKFSIETRKNWQLPACRPRKTGISKISSLLSLWLKQSLFCIADKNRCQLID